MKPVNLPRLRCALLGLLPFGERRAELHAQVCSGRNMFAHAKERAVGIETNGRADAEMAGERCAVAQKKGKL